MRCWTACAPLWTNSEVLPLEGGRRDVIKKVLPLDGEGVRQSLAEGVKRAAFQIFSKNTHSTAASQRSPSPIKGEDLGWGRF